MRKGLNGKLVPAKSYEGKRMDGICALKRFKEKGAHFRSMRWPKQYKELVFHSQVRECPAEMCNARPVAPPLLLS